VLRSSVRSISNATEWISAVDCRMTPADLLKRPDDVTAWIRLDLLTRCIIGRRMEQGPSPALDKELDKLIILRVDGAAAGELKGIRNFRAHQGREGVAAQREIPT
jgi:hypothetical protein